MPGSEVTRQIRAVEPLVLDCAATEAGLVKDYFKIGQRYAVADFVARSRESLTIASERVKAKFGFDCTGVADQLEAIIARAANFEQLPDAWVTIEEFEE
ncbi:MAG: hypothetical protein JWL69_3555 [Phycisphaerales bacterium]|nr:hypothetical protein [Phycisphaerales bacterium]